MKKHLRNSTSPVSLALLALSTALSLYGCEVIAGVDRSLIDGGGGAPGDGTDSSSAGQSSSSEMGAGAGGQPSVGGGAPSTEGVAGEGGAGFGSAGEASQGGALQGMAGEPAAGGAAQGLGGDAGLGGAGGQPAGPGGKVIYLSGTPKKASFGGISGADAQCNASPPIAGTYKALLVDGTTRVACTSASCTTGGAAEGVDWVLAPNTKYVRQDGTVIGTTNGAGIFVFPLDASIAAAGDSFWTGLEADWTTSTDDCAGWTETSGVFATEGLADATDSQAIVGVNESCATLAGAFFACVEQ